MGEYTIFRIEIAMASSLGETCYVRVKFPSDFTTDSYLTSISGTGFLQPENGNSATRIIKDDSNSDFTF